MITALRIDPYLNPVRQAAMTTVSQTVSVSFVDLFEPFYLRDHCIRPGETLVFVIVDANSTAQTILSDLTDNALGHSKVPASISGDMIHAEAWSAAVAADHANRCMIAGGDYDSFDESSDEDHEGFATAWFRLSWEA
jgi:hypothetical protein